MLIRLVFFLGFSVVLLKLFGICVYVILLIIIRSNKSISMRSVLARAYHCGCFLFLLSRSVCIRTMTREVLPWRIVCSHYTKSFQLNRLQKRAKLKASIICASELLFQFTSILENHLKLASPKLNWQKRSKLMTCNCNGMNIACAKYNSGGSHKNNKHFSATSELMAIQTFVSSWAHFE